MKTKYTIKTTCLAGWLLLLLQGCESDVDFNGKESAAKMVINSIINAEKDKQILKLSESVFVFGNQRPQLVKDATLQLKVNGNEVPLTFEENKGQHQYYCFPSGLNIGDKLEIAGKSQEHGSVYGVDYVPESANIKEMKTEWFTGKADGKSYLRTLVTIKDRADEKNYYRIVVRGKTLYEINGDDEDSLPWIQYPVYVDQEILFNNISGTPGEDDDGHEYRIFSDDLFNGKDYTLNVYVQEDRADLWGVNPQTFIKVEIHTLSENLYKYLRSIELAEGEDNFSEPVKIFSNIDGGYGILGVYNVCSEISKIER